MPRRAAVSSQPQRKRAASNKRVKDGESPTKKRKVAARKEPAKKTPAKKAPARLHKLAPVLPAGTIVTDVFKKRWQIGGVIGTGGFGAIYLASDDVTKPVGENAEHVIKVEPVGNGPLFCELHFYQRAAKPFMLKVWKSSKKLKYLGVPEYQNTGILNYKSTEYRFMVMQRFGTDLQKIFEENGKRFGVKTVLQLGLRILDVLEYIHENEYVHADIKAANLLVGYKKGKPTNEIYLVDYGLVYRYCPSGKHKEYIEDPRKCHDGTIEFTSIDMHRGVGPSRRADLEILGYCMLQWLCGRLPWEDNLKNCDYVAAEKIKYMSNLKKLMKDCFKKDKPVEEIAELLEYSRKLGYTEKPDYCHIRRMFKSALKSRKMTDDGYVELPVLASSTSARCPTQSRGKAGRKRNSSESGDSLSTSPNPVRKSSKPKLSSPRKSIPRRRSRAVNNNMTPIAEYDSDSDAEYFTPPQTLHCGDSSGDEGNGRALNKRRQTLLNNARRRSSLMLTPSQSRALKLKDKALNTLTKAQPDKGTLKHLAFARGPPLPGQKRTGTKVAAPNRRR